MGAVSVAAAAVALLAAVYVGYSRVREHGAELADARARGVRLDALLRLTAAGARNVTDFQFLRAERDMCEATGSVFARGGCRWTAESCAAVAAAAPGGEHAPGDLYYADGRCYDLAAARSFCEGEGLQYVPHDPADPASRPRCAFSKQYCDGLCVGYDAERRECQVRDPAQAFFEDGGMFNFFSVGRNVTRGAMKAFGKCPH